MRYADPVAQAEIDRLRAALLRVGDLLFANAARNQRNDVSLGFTHCGTTWIRADAVVAALAEPEETDV